MLLHPSQHRSTPEWFAFPALLTPEARIFDFNSQTIVIIGAGSNVRKFGVRWAKVTGIGAIIAVASLSHEKDLKAVGTTHVINHHSATIVQDMQRIASDKDGMTHIYDCVNWTVSRPAV